MSDETNLVTFSQKDFDHMRKVLYDHAGITLAEHKKEMAYNRLTRRLRELRLTTFAQYFQYLDKHEEEFGQFINAMTTNLTAFFREKHHFDYLETELLPSLKHQRRLRGWSAACSVGEEPYSLAISILGAKNVDVSGWDIHIIASDIDTKVLEVASRGVYAIERIDSLPDRIKKEWFLRGKGKNQGQVRVKPELQRILSFQQVNLMKEWPIEGGLDFIFCRNVMIYFDKETQAKLLSRMADMLRPEGLLFVGHSESPYRLTNRFKLIGQTIYRKVS